jgi:hypothetical protein
MLVNDTKSFSKSLLPEFLRLHNVAPIWFGDAIKGTYPKENAVFSGFSAPRLDRDFSPLIVGVGTLRIAEFHKLLIHDNGSSRTRGFMFHDPLIETLYDATAEPHREAGQQ